MKTKIFILVLFSLLAFTNLSFSQGETAVQFLTFPVSPSQTGMGATGTSLPNDDPFGFLLNPAQLGHISQSTNLSFAFYPSKVKLWGFDEFTINSFAINAGYNFKELLNIPISLGVGYANSKYLIDYSNAIQFPFEEMEQFSTLSLGVGIDYYVQLNAGISSKSINSKIPDYTSSSFPPPSYEADANAIDFGFLINIPVIKLIDDQLSFELFNNNPTKPFFDLSFGYSQLNIGDEIYYIDPAQSDPLPRTAKLGYGISTGFDFEINNTFIRAFSFDFTVDAEDKLLEYEIINSGNPVIPDMKRFKGYQSFIGDINIGKNIFQIEGDENVISKTGFQINVFEFFTYKQGHLSGDGYNSVKTNGYEIRSKGILRFINAVSSNEVIKYITNSFDLRYSYSKYSIDDDIETKFHGISIYFQNLNSLF
jgi:hypothetical protein